MQSHRLRILIFVLLGLSVSINPVKARYTWTLQGASAEPFASFPPKTVKRIRPVNMRVVSVQSARDCSQVAAEPPSHFACRPKKPTSHPLTPFYPNTGRTTSNSLVHPLRC
jgi:hypothetical protein